MAYSVGCKMGLICTWPEGGERTEICFKNRKTCAEEQGGGVARGRTVSFHANGKELEDNSRADFIGRNLKQKVRRAEAVSAISQRALKKAAVGGRVGGREGGDLVAVWLQG